MMLTNQTLVKMLYSYNASAHILNDNEQETSSFLKISPMTPTEPNYNQLDKTHYLMVFLFLWGLFVVIAPLLFLSNSSDEENLEETDDDSSISDNGTAIVIEAKYDSIVIQLQNQNLPIREDVDFV